VRTFRNVAAASFALLLLSGCSAIPGVRSTSTQSSSVQGAAIQGKVHGGQQAIVGASVYLYAANNSGYGNASVSLLTSATGNPADGNGNYYVTTGSDGSFGITGDYTCPSTTSQLYLYATGGNPGSGANSAIGLLAALGTCQANSTLSSSLYVVINEVSTIATAYSIAGYATDPLQVSSPNTTLAQTGIANAFATVTNLETLATGTALATTPAANGGNGTVPQSEIDTLANILAECINSTGPASTACATLFSNAKNGNTAPADTATAAINIAHNPGTNITALYDIQTGHPSFLPQLGAVPNDFTIAISYTGGGLDDSCPVVIDASDNVWVGNDAGGVDNGSISKFSPTGAALSGSSGYTGGGLTVPTNMAIDGSGNVWATTSNPRISELSSSGIPISPANTGYTGGGLDGTVGIAIDASNNVWVSNFLDNPGSISEFNSSGTPYSSSPITGGGLDTPDDIAVDVSGNVWVINVHLSGSLSEFNSSGTPYSSSPFTGGGMQSPAGIAVDASGNIWIPNNTGLPGIAEFNSSGMAISPAPNGYTGGGLLQSDDIAVDGSGNIWAISVLDGSGLSEFSSSGTPISSSYGYAYGSPVLNKPCDFAIDGSGNVWVTNYGALNIVTEFVGLAAPVVTPIVANLLSPYGQHAVNKP
jgi:hypothetical protein